MADTDANAVSEAARSLAARRWDPDAVLARAAATVIGRASELDEWTRAAIEAAINEEAPRP